MSANLINTNGFRSMDASTIIAKTITSSQNLTGKKLHAPNWLDNDSSMNALCRLNHIDQNQVASIQHTWNNLVQDPYPAGKYRTRRMGRFEILPDGLKYLKQVSVCQTKKYQSTDGDIPRYFEPLSPALIESEAFLSIAKTFLDTLPLNPVGGVFWCHQVRVRANDDLTSGAPSPQGIHSDERDFIGVFVANHQNVTCSKTSIYLDKNSAPVFEKVLRIGEMIVFNDAVVLHNTEPFTVNDDFNGSSTEAYRDIFILDYTADHTTGVWIE